jgi:hypothetical protein
LRASTRVPDSSTHALPIGASSRRASARSSVTSRTASIARTSVAATRTRSSAVPNDCVSTPRVGGLDDGPHRFLARDIAQILQHPQRRPHRMAADAMQLGQFMLGRQQTAHHMAAFGYLANQHARQFGVARGGG